MSRIRGRREWTVGVVLLAAFAVNLSLTFLTIAVKEIASTFDATPLDAGWVTFAPMVISALLTPAFARAADMYGRMRTWILGLGVVIVGMALSAVAPTLAFLVIARVVTGVGAAAVMPAGLALLTAAYPPTERSKPIGWWTSVVAISPAVGVAVGGIFLGFLSWRWMFIAQLPVALVALVLALLTFKEARHPQPGRFDLLGAAIAAAVIFSFLVIVNRIRVLGPDSPFILGCIAAVVVGTPAFLLVERRVPNPVIPPEIFHDAAMSRAIVGRALLTSIYMGSFMILPLFFMNVLGYSALVASFAVLIRPLAMSVTGPFIGTIVTRFGATRMALAGGVAITLAALAFSTVGLTTVYPIVAIPLVVQGLGLGLMSSAATTIATNRTDPTELGTISGVLAISTSLANSVGMAVMLSIVDLAGGMDSTQAYRISFYFGLAVCIVGLLTLVGMARRLKEEKATWDGVPDLTLAQT
ncbi:MAG: MFS transporter [Acidimicrobiia bacterium]|nr:MFS transporter [Acidimicrobiia bacterium]